MDLDRYLSYIRCPQCHEDLKRSDSTFDCDSCKTSYPSVGHIPWVLCKPENSINEWKNQALILENELIHKEENIKEKLKSNLLELTQKRLRKTLQFTVEHRKTISEILRPLSTTKEIGTAISAQRTLATTQNLLSYFSNITRDWAWGESENIQALEAVTSILDKDELKGSRMLALGAGASRLPYDLHQFLEAEYSIFADINPLMLMSSKLIIQGKKLNIKEFPIAPLDLDNTAQEHKCKVPKPERKTIDYIFADATSHPFREKSFDIVFTPWLIDIVSESPDTFFKKLNSLLVEDGTWINTGSLFFDRDDEAERYSWEEIQEIAQDAGFNIKKSGRVSMPYLQNKGSGHQRNEVATSLIATKTRHVVLEKPEIDTLDDWQTNFENPVPKLQNMEIAGITYSVYQDVLKLIDGKRSVKEIASIFGPKHGLSKQDAMGSILRFLDRMRRGEF